MIITLSFYTKKPAYLNKNVKRTDVTQKYCVPTFFLTALWLFGKQLYPLEKYNNY